MAQDNCAIVQREADPKAVGGDQRQDRPQEHTFEQIVQGTKQQAPEPMPISENNLALTVKGPCRLDCHIDSLLGQNMACIQCDKKVVDLRQG